VVIRDATDADFDAIAGITNHYIRHTPIHFGYDPVTGAELAAPWRNGRALYPYLVMTNDPGQVIGYAKAGKWRERAAYDRTAEVGIYLLPGWEGRGLGRTLYAALIEACRTRGLHSLIGGIALPNEASVRLHLGLGFVHVGTVREAGWKFEKWHGVAFYQLML
jgi:phosphinothricin acetyltransferase